MSTLRVPATRESIGDPRRELGARIGNTTLLRLRSLEPRAGVKVFAKAEWENLGGSVKARAAYAMILDGERWGGLTPGRTLIDASSGNTGIAYAVLGGRLGYRVTVVAPGNLSRERRHRILAEGAELILTDPQEGMDGAIDAAARRALAEPGRYFYPDQYNNPANWKAHYHGTGAEIWNQTRGTVTHFVAGLGTTGTFVGTGRRLKRYLPGVELIAVEPDSPLHGLEGLKHLDSARVPGIHDPSLAGSTERVDTDSALNMAGRLQAHEGLAPGPSAAAAAVAAERVAARLEEGVVVTVFPDNDDKYHEEPYWRPTP